MKNQYNISFQPSLVSNNDRITFINFKNKEISMTLEELVSKYNESMKKKEAYWWCFQTEKLKVKVLEEKIELMKRVYSEKGGKYYDSK